MAWMGALAGGAGAGSAAGGSAAGGAGGAGMGGGMSSMLGGMGAGMMGGGGEGKGGKGGNDSYNPLTSAFKDTMANTDVMGQVTNIGEIQRQQDSGPTPLAIALGARGGSSFSSAPSTLGKSMSDALSPKTGGETDSDLRTALAGTQNSINQLDNINFDDALQKRYPNNYGLSLK